jgi:protoporphyrin/coproporphyrin ferrochelatase
MIETRFQLSKTGRIGVVLINLGTPDNYTYWPVRRYLKEFLSDRRVIENNRLVWWFVLNGIVLTARPWKSGRNYEKIWNRELGESPLKTITRAQAAAVAQMFRNEESITVDWAMRYGTPSIADRLRLMREQGHERILLVPLYPQYSASTTATALDKAYATLAGMRWQPAIRTLPPYYDDSVYIEALVESVRTHEATIGWTPDLILSSFHGLPQAYVERGDPYYQHCMTSAQLLKDALGLPNDRFSVAFQSRFGRAEWLKPYADRTVEKLAMGGCRKLMVVCPGFSADCVETLEEIAIGLRETFMHHGGQEFSVVPCLNASKPSIRMLSLLIGRELAGWI